MKNKKNKFMLMLLVCFSMILFLLPSVSSQTQLTPTAIDSGLWTGFNSGIAAASGIDGLEIFNSELFGIGGRFTDVSQDEHHIQFYGNGSNGYFAKSSINVSDIAARSVVNRGLWVNETHFIFSHSPEFVDSWAVVTREGIFVENISADVSGACSDIDERTLTGDGESNIIYVACDSTGGFDIASYLPNGTFLGINVSTPVDLYAIHWSPTFQRWYVGTGDNDTIYELLANGVPTGLERALDSPANDANFISGIADDGNFIYVSANGEEFYILNPADFSTVDNIPVVFSQGTRGITSLNGVTYAVNDDFHSNSVWTIAQDGSIASRVFSTRKDGLTRTRGIGSDSTHLYITDDTLDTVNKYLPNGSLIQSFSVTGAIRNMEFAADTGNFWGRASLGNQILEEFTSSFVATGLIINLSLIDPNAFSDSTMIRDGIIYLGQETIYTFDTLGILNDNFIINISGNILQDAVGDYGTDGITVWVRNPQGFEPFDNFVVTYALSEWLFVPPTSSTSILFNGLNQDITLIVDDETFIVSALGINGTPTIFRDGTPILNNSVQDLSVGTFNFTAIIESNENITGSRDTLFANVITIGGTQSILVTIGTSVLVIGIIIATIAGFIRDRKKGKKANMKLSVFFIVGLLLMPLAYAQSVFANPAFDFLLVLFFMVAAFIIIRNMMKDKK